MRLETGAQWRSGEEQQRRSGQMRKLYSAPAKRRATANRTQHSALSTQHSALNQLFLLDR
ncbi:hypothetical protein [Nostoc sp. UHCC 0870]|uniref:hypothetical protein n=1 Tax=Nostoc sp. UHCC 0870 TaxID=2914041 RepID=UPI001EDFC421|nr:hypothetical protein [Nostoc sp. UHCC 0870]UKP00350.1 hypothetical protein L6494_11895 [Nostoc sp. UHCC 0870]